MDIQGILLRNGLVANIYFCIVLLFLIINYIFFDILTNVEAELISDMLT